MEEVEFAKDDKSAGSSATPQSKLYVTDTHSTEKSDTSSRLKVTQMSNIRGNNKRENRMHKLIS